MYSYFRFLYQSNNQHGVHSPFVYQLITTCFYAKNSIYPQWKNQKTALNVKEKQFLWRFLTYIQPSEIIDWSIHKDLENLPTQKFTDTKNKKIQYFGNNIAMAATMLYKKETFIENDDIWIVNKMHKNKTNYMIWNALKSNSRVMVTVDVYFFGLIFFRKEQAQQHFKIRV
jgi:hypothetical protein